VISKVGFGASTRIYALTYLTFWLMLFVNPSSDAYMENPSDPWTQSIMTCDQLLSSPKIFFGDLHYTFKLFN
jgi:hypothetical protein